MELRDILVIDIESLSAVQAQQIAGDAIAVLARGGLTGPEQDQLKTMLIAAKEIETGRKVGDSQDNVRQEVLQKIKEAEERGDKRTARYLAESMGRADVSAAALAEQTLTEAARKYLADDTAAAEALRTANLQERIEIRTQELLRVDGSAYDYSPKQARKQATREVMGRPRYEDDINDEPETPDRRAILDAREGLQ